MTTIAGDVAAAAPMAADEAAALAASDAHGTLMCTPAAPSPTRPLQRAPARTSAAPSPPAGRWLRVTGRLVQVHLAAGRALVEHRGSTLTVDLRLVPGPTPPLRTLVQATGVLEADDALDDDDDEADLSTTPTTRPLVLAARHLVSVEGLDMRAYERALALRRAALETPL